MFAELATAFGLGLLIGVERGWRLRDQPAGTRVAGVRTFGLIGLLGGLVGQLAPGPAMWIGVVAAGGTVAVIVTAYHRGLADEPPARSMTNATAAIITLVLGTLATSGQPRAAIVAAGVVVAVLTSRNRMHAWLESLDEADIRASAKFVLVTMIILPLLPSVDFGPYGAINLRNLWLVVVFVTGLSFAGYWAGKRLGSARGTLIAAAIGATYSSTAITAELSRRLRNAHGDSSESAALRAGIAAATAIMLCRVLLLTGIIVPQGFTRFAVIVGPAAVVATIMAIYAACRVGRSTGTVTTGSNPMALAPAIGFAAVVGLILIVSRWAISRYGDAGLATLLALTGLYDVDAAIVTVGNLDVATAAGRPVGLLLAIPILVNTLMKAVFVVALGGPRRALGAVAPLLATAFLLACGLTATIYLSP